MSTKRWDSHQNLGTWPPQPSGGHSSFHTQHMLHINLQTDLQNAKGRTGNRLNVQKEQRKIRSGVFSPLMKYISELSHQALFPPPRKTGAEVCTQVSPILDKWPKLRDNLPFPLCFKGKGWWPLHHARMFHAQRTPPWDQVFLEKKGVATHLIYGNMWSFPHRLERGGQPPPPFKERGA